jgi:membrane protein YqaA with SNARE-associated domain
MNIPLDEWSGSKATKQLQASVERIQRENSRLGRWMLGLAAVAAIGAVIAAVPVVQGWFR